MFSSPVFRNRTLVTFFACKTSFFVVRYNRIWRRLFIANFSNCSLTAEDFCVQQFYGFIELQIASLSENETLILVKALRKLKTARKICKVKTRRMRINIKP